MFPTLCDFIDKTETHLSSEKVLISAHLKNLEEEFSIQFNNFPGEEFKWILNPFNQNLKFNNLPLSLQKQLIKIKEDINLQTSFYEKDLQL